MAAKAFTVKELKTLLDKMPDNAMVVLSMDAEGNQFSPLCDFSTGSYVMGRKPWDLGMFYDPDDTIPGNQQTKKALALWPM